ncbi:MAG: dockerin type I repeat-containing protein [Clostridia bacterium]|nr:dockerin type I repeat-containing protein [Clostridia bacterium]
MKKIISVTAAASLLLCAVICVAAFLLGDANGDGEVNNKDVATLFRHVSGSNIKCLEENCDINGDGDINNKDVVALFRKLSEMQTAETDEPGMINDETDSEDSGSFNDMFG